MRFFSTLIVKSKKFLIHFLTVCSVKNGYNFRKKNYELNILKYMAKDQNHGIYVQAYFSADP